MLSYSLLIVWTAATDWFKPIEGLPSWQLYQLQLIPCVSIQSLASCCHEQASTDQEATAGITKTPTRRGALKGFSGLCSN